MDALPDPRTAGLPRVRALLVVLAAVLSGVALLAGPGVASAQPTPGAERTVAGKAAYRAFVTSVRGKPTLVVAFHPL